MTSLRNTQAVFGMGFLEAVPEATLVRLAEEQKKQGLNGRVNRVYDDTLKKNSSWPVWMESQSALDPPANCSSLPRGYWSELFLVSR